MTVMLDCDCKERDGSDGASSAFIFTDQPKDKVLEKYPDLRDKVATANAVDGESAGWIRQDHVRECLYYEVTEDKDELLGDDNGTTVFASTVPKSLQKQWATEHVERGSRLKRRPVIRKSVKSHLIIGNDLVETTDMPGTSVPIIPWVGQIVVINQIMDRKSHTRTLLDAQRMLNYNWSASVEFGALQSKSSWLVPVAAIGDYMTLLRHGQHRKSCVHAVGASRRRGARNPQARTDATANGRARLSGGRAVGTPVHAPPRAALTDFANHGKVWLTHTSTGQRIQVNYDDALKNPAKDPPVYPDDQINVEKRIF